MSSFTVRSAGVVLGMTLPLLAWGLADDTRTHAVPDDENVAEYATILAQYGNEVLDASLVNESALADPAAGDRICTKNTGETDESTTACCWVYYIGRWWCFSC